MPEVRTFSRRRLLTATGVGAAAALLYTQLPLPFRDAVSTAEAVDDPRHLVWVWQLETDVSVQPISEVLSRNGLGLLLKTHDGTEWMSAYDPSPFAPSGVSQVGVLASYFEGKGVPFHAWTVLKGQDPIREAEMAASVLAAGARTLYLNVQSQDGFWEGSMEDAQTFGLELRRLKPDAHLMVVVDPRPWRLKEVPVAMFATFCNGFAPLHFWSQYDTTEDHDLFEAAGFPVPEDGVTPEFLSHVTQEMLGGFGQPIQPVGESLDVSVETFGRFLDAAKGAGASSISAWRYGEISDDLYALMADRPATPPKALARTHIIEPGDTLSTISETYGVSVEVLIEANGISDADVITAGQELLIP